MFSSSVQERNEAADYLCKLADIVEDTGMSAREVGLMLADTFRQSPVEHSAEVRQQVADMSGSKIASKRYASGLRWQAYQLRQPVA